MSAALETRPARADDAAGLVRLIRASFDPARLATTIYGCAGIEAFVRDQIEAPAGRADRRFVVALDSGVAGCADWSVDRDGVFLGYVAVETRLRRRGVGQALLRSIFDAAPAREEGATFRLDVYADNAPARTWYEGLGMAVEGESEVWDVPVPAGVAAAPGAAISGWPQAAAAWARFGFGAFTLVVPGAAYPVGLLGERWLRIADPGLLERPEALAALGALDPARRILAIVPAGTPVSEHRSGARRLASTLRMRAPIEHVRARLLYP